MASLSTTLTTSLHPLLHFIPHKLNSSNYLAWSQQVKLVLSLQTLLGHIDGSTKPPAETLSTDDKTSPNPDYATWLAKDQAVRLLIQSSLSEEAMSEIVGLHTARQIWLSLETAYSHPSLNRMHTLRDNLRLLQKGSSAVAEFGRKFKALCDQLAAIGHPVDETDKCHWFLCGLGPAYEHFSTTYHVVGISSFRELIAKPENQEIFMHSFPGQQSPPVAFTAQSSRSGNSRSNSGSNYSNRGRGRGRGEGRGRTRRPPQCQLCRTDGYYANACPNLASFAKQASSADANLAHAFHAQCHVTVTDEDHPDWAGDTGAIEKQRRSWQREPVRTDSTSFEKEIVRSLLPTRIIISKPPLTNGTHALVTCRLILFLDCIDMVLCLLLNFYLNLKFVLHVNDLNLNVCLLF
ncbi:putative RNA-directed DNA polymerase [Helianthus annuus]|uniref:RNA-directed DNA polymerase n=1 Tax=Helianthus annuus TaxID=4232 RepID=A0A9K3INH7_HELAN|nr:putative RNA-directed DNA polymerase [Helianthus annuus]